MIATLKTVATRVVRPLLSEEDEFVRYYRGFRLAFLPEASGRGTGTVEPLSDAAIYAWDRRQDLEPLHVVAARFTRAADFFLHAQGLCDEVLATRQ